MMLWVPVEKLFMSEIGFTPASIGLMAGVYALAVPVLEIPSGLLADRWSRKGVLVAATAALVSAVAIAAASNSVGLYMLSALCLGVYIAMQSGTTDSILYDTLIEEGEDTVQFDRLLGQLGMISSVTLVVSSLVGGWIASVWSPRTAYVATLPFIAASIIALACIREPHLHRQTIDETGGRRSLAVQARDTFATITRRSEVRRVALLMALCAMLVQMVIEFGPLWLLELRSKPGSYGPFSAAAFGALGVGGWLAGHVDLHRRSHRRIAVAVIAASTATFSTLRNMPGVTIAMAGFVTTLVVARIALTAKLHAASESSVRAGVSSAVSTLSFVIFLPISVVFGLITDRSGVYMAAILMAAVAFIVATLLTAMFRPVPIAPAVTS
jgi:MFS family permease